MKVERQQRLGGIALPLLGLGVGMILVNRVSAQAVAPVPIRMNTMPINVGVPFMGIGASLISPSAMPSGSLVGPSMSGVFDIPTFPSSLGRTAVLLQAPILPAPSPIGANNFRLRPAPIKGEIGTLPRGDSHQFSNFSAGQTLSVRLQNLQGFIASAPNASKEALDSFYSGDPAHVVEPNVNPTVNVVAGPDRGGKRGWMLSYFESAIRPSPYHDVPYSAGHVFKPAQRPTPLRLVGNGLNEGPFIDTLNRADRSLKTFLSTLRTNIFQVVAVGGELLKTAFELPMSVMGVANSAWREYGWSETVRRPHALAYSAQMAEAPSTSFRSGEHQVAAPTLAPAGAAPVIRSELTQDDSTRAGVMTNISSQSFSRTLFVSGSLMMAVSAVMYLLSSLFLQLFAVASVAASTEPGH